MGSAEESGRCHTYLQQLRGSDIHPHDCIVKVKMRPPAAIYGIIGHPLAHSASPALYTLGFARAGVAAVYMAFPLPPEKLADFFTAVRVLPLSGGNITLPHKVTSMEFLDEVSPTARRVGAVNTFYWKDGRLCGHNTDIAGFTSPIRKRRFTRALVLGAGGAARAVLAGLQAMGLGDIMISNRTAAHAEALAEDFGVHVLPWAERAVAVADLVVNATSLGMKGAGASASPFPKQGFRGRGLAYDIVYNPLDTPFLKDARAAGWKTQSGLSMFVEQARQSFTLWVPGRDMSVRSAVEVVKKHLGP